MKVYRLQATDDLVPTQPGSHSCERYAVGMPAELKATFDKGAVYASGTVDTALAWMGMSDLWDDCNLYELEVGGPVFMHHMYDGTVTVVVTEHDAQQIALYIDEFLNDPSEMGVDPECCQLVVPVESVTKVTKVA